MYGTDDVRKKTMLDNTKPLGQSEALPLKLEQVAQEFIDIRTETEKKFSAIVDTLSDNEIYQLINFYEQFSTLGYCNWLRDFLQVYMFTKTIMKKMDEVAAKTWCLQHQCDLSKCPKEDHD